MKNDATIIEHNGGDSLKVQKLISEIHKSFKSLCLKCDFSYGKLKIPRKRLNSGNESSKRMAFHSRFPLLK
jgi:hypothetical protein